jgi:hypothetical protein
MEMLQLSAVLDRVKMVAGDAGLVARTAEHDQPAVGPGGDGIEIIRDFMDTRLETCPPFRLRDRPRRSTPK